MNCTCEQPTNDCPEHGTGCDGRRYMALKAERDELRLALALAQSMIRSGESMTEKSAAVIDGARVSWDGYLYKVSRPNYDGGEVVDASEHDRLRLECSTCEKCGHVQAEPNWCHECGHRVSMPLWAGRLLEERDHLRQALENVRDELSNGPTANWDFIELQWKALEQ